MPFAKWERLVTNAAGDVVENCYVEVRRLPGLNLLTPVYADYAGAATKANPFTVTDGRAKFYAVAGRYRIRVYNGAGYETTWDDELVGTLAGQDANAYTGPGFTWSPEDATGTPPAEGCIRANNADWSAATHLYVHDTTLSGSDATSWLLGLDPGSKSIKNRVLLSLPDGSELSWEVDDVTDAGDYLDITVSGYVGPAGPVSVAPSGFVVLSREQSGVDGSHAGLDLAYSSTTTDADPGAGTFRLNHATHASATAAYIDNTNAAGGTISPELDTWDDSTSTVKGTLRIVNKADLSVFRQYAISGSVVDGTGYRKITLTYVSGNGSLSDGDRCMLQFLRTGDAGSNGTNGTNGTDGVDGTGLFSRVRAVATTNITIATALNDGDSLDGVTLATNDLVLVAGQAAPEENGVYVVGVSPARDGSFDTYDEHPGVYFSVMEGTTSGDTLWRCTSNKGGTIGATALTITQFTGAGISMGKAIAAAIVFG